MKRLRDETDSTDPTVAAAGRLLSQVRPWSESEVRAQRVRRALERKVPGSRFRGILLGLAVVFGLAGSAAAAVGAAKWLSRATEEVETAPSSGISRATGPDNGKAESPVHGARDSSSAAIGAPASSSNSSQSAPLKASTSATTSPRATSATPKNQISRSAAGATPTPSLSEARLVQGAVAALRSGEDPEKAERLLAEYRKNSTSGSLDEEALALSIEVALAKKDPRARDYARRYLRDYPQGKFKSLAERALP